VLPAGPAGPRPGPYVAPAAPRADSGAVRRDDEDDRSGEAGRAGGGASWADGIVVPDDLSELDAEVRALHRERRARRRRDRLRRLTGPAHSAGPVLMVAILLVAGVTGLLVLLQPRRTAGTVTTADGTAQNLDRRLPDVPVRLADGTDRRIREFRPAVLALAPAGCRCDAALREVGTAAQRHGIPLLLVDRTAPPLPPGLGPTAIRLAEPTGEIATRYGAERDGRRVPGGPVLVLVGSGGQVSRVLPRVTPRTLDRELAALKPQAAPAS
jgi:hypothetical protein